jgi:hypothetical protein
MEIPEILKGGVHLPLKEGMTSVQAIELCNGFYLTALSAEDFKQSQAFLNPSRQFALELIDKESGEVLVTFTNKTMAVQPVEEGSSLAVDDSDDWVIDNPLYDTGTRAVWLNAPITVHNVEELEFLDIVGVGNTYPIVGTDNTVAYTLAQLLNNYRVMGGWMSGTIGELCTGGFKLVYKGSTQDLPTEFMVDYSEMVAIVEILHGSQQGYLCLRV